MRRRPGACSDQALGLRPQTPTFFQEDRPSEQLCWDAQVLKSLEAEHRVLLTGTPLQNNLTELFMLMHFLDRGKFEDPDAFEAQFAQISQDGQVLPRLAF